MSTDWNEKLTLLLHIHPFTALGAKSDPLASTEGMACVTDAERKADIDKRIALAMAWVHASADRAPMAPMDQDKAPSVDWAAKPEVTHPLSNSRQTISITAPADDVAREILKEVGKRFPDDARKQALWVYRFLAERVAQETKNPWWLRVPFDGRSPDHTVWQEQALVSALACATETPSLMVFDLGVIDGWLEEVADAASYEQAVRVASWLSWSAARVVIDELGPDALVFPWLRAQPWFDAMLAQEGISLSAKDSGEQGVEAGHFPHRWVCLLPGAKVDAVGAMCLEACSNAWKKLWRNTHDALAKKVGVAVPDSAWTGLWERQLTIAIDPRWFAVSLEEDSTGAGTLLSGREVSGFDKPLKQRKDCTGVEQTGRGAYWGLWYAASLAAADTREYARGLVVEEGAPRCTLCGARQAVGGNDAAVAGLCAPCVTKRVVGEMADGAVPKWVFAAAKPHGAVAGTYHAVVRTDGDNLRELLRGTVEGGSVATLRSALHSDLPAQLMKQRSRWKDVLDAPVLPGALRNAGMIEGLGEFAMRAAPAVVAGHKGELLAACGAEIVAEVGGQTALALTTALRESYRTPIAMEGEVPRLHMGPTATLSAVVVVAPQATGTGWMVEQTREWAERLEREGLGRDILLMSMGHVQGRQALFACRWDDLGTALQDTADAFRAMPNAARVVDEIVRMRAAIANVDMDKARGESRVGLVRMVIGEVGAMTDEAQREKVARAIVGLVDRNLATVLDSDGDHTMDGLYIAQWLGEVAQ